MFKEMRCLQDHFEEKEFISKHRRCYEELSEFTKMEVKDTALNRALTKACKPVISTYCSVLFVCLTHLLLFNYESS